MTPRQSDWPRQWLMTDERLGDRLWQAIGALPPGAGIVFRHHRTTSRQRHELAARIAECARDRSLVLAVARDCALAMQLGAQLLHNPDESRPSLPFSRAAHSLAEANAARIEGAALVFVSPVHATRSHPGKRPLGEPLALQIADAARVPAIALGGMDARRYALLRGGFYGWAGIDAWLGGEVRT